MNQRSPSSEPQPKNLVIRASAGTGKTFQLSNRFLQRILDGAPLDTILATTFTRKAAGEILDRILLRLAEAALEPDKLAALAEQLDRAELDQAKCLAVVQTMVRQLHRFRVGTLDSVFAQIARSFSLELGLPPGWRIADEPIDRRMRLEAISQMLENRSTSDTLRLMHLLSKGEAARSVTRQIFDLVDDLYSTYIDSPAEAWEALPRHKSLNPLQLADALNELASVELPNDKRFVNARDGDLTRAENLQWEVFLSKGLAAKVVNGESTYQRKPISAEVVAAYEPLIGHAKAQIIAVIAGQTEGTREMLARFEQSYTRLQTSQRLLRFDDVTRRLGEASGRQPIEQVVYRLDAHLAHLLLDEFQDTSPAQWRVLRRFAERIVGNQSDTFFCVGDVKQAIYGWRGGVAEILEAITNELKPLDSAELNKSFRSSPVVIDLVNRVFQRLANNGALENYQPAVEAWTRRFATHSTARADLAGYCRLESAPAADEGQRQVDVTLDFAAERIAALHRNTPDRSIGVLVRRNASVARLIHRLRQRDILASEEGGNPLTDSVAVQLVLSVLRLADHPGDTASRFHVARGPMAEVLGLTRFDDNHQAWRLSTGLRRQLVEDGYGPTIYEWTTRLAPHCNPRDLDRLLQLVEMAYGYESKATTRTDDFIELVERQRIEDPSSSAVRVMTIHQAKGLQFDVVVLPELDYKLLGQPPRLVVGRSSPTEPASRVCRYVSKELRPILPRAFVDMFEHDGQQRVEESLCLLYVALTRAVHALHVIIGPSKPNEKKIPATSAGVLREALADRGAIEPETVLFEQGNPNWHDKTRATGSASASPRYTSAPGDNGTSRSRVSPSSTGEASGTPLDALGATAGLSSSARPKPMPIDLAQPARHPRRGLDRRSPSHLEGGPQVDLASRLRFDTGTARERGTVIHAWFEQVGWLDDERPSDEQLLQLARQYVSDAATIDRWMADFRAALERPQVAAVFDRAQYGRPAEQLRLWRERPFAIRQDDAILKGTIDRLVVSYEGSRPVAADVIDFKSDRLSADDPDAINARAEYYRPQMEAYARAVTSMFRLPAEKVTTRLVFAEPGVVKKV